MNSSKHPRAVFSPRHGRSHSGLRKPFSFLLPQTTAEEPHPQSRSWSRAPAYPSQNAHAVGSQDKCPCQRTLGNLLRNTSTARSCFQLYLRFFTRFGCSCFKRHFADYPPLSLSLPFFFLFLFPASCLSWVPEQGTVGASGDLAPLAHLALGLLGEGKMWSPETGWGEAKYVIIFSTMSRQSQLPN